ncbi:hydroxypyruvate isomerase [Pueribacillus theae]|uniref:Hydroxypyruvate isomerase n=1 Tax=Pueribacillus theae TaxID=2171751 RepID=A0A2U1K6U3_9BACI|nr:hydroxypyruvate isomerase [Pueribacillus theae]PWA13250.1 hydroxypyruvate isomerase [Pueribacillus theae]
MYQFAANLTTLFTEVPFLERFKKAKDSGFTHVEFQFPYAFSPEQIKQKLHEYELKTVLFNLPPGNWEQGDRGIAILPSRREEFEESVEQAIRYARELKCNKLHCMAGILPEGTKKEVALSAYKDNLRFAAEQLHKHGLTLVIEPINTFDMPGYLLSNLGQAVEMIHELKMPNLKLQFDFYHIQRMQGELLNSFKQHKGSIAHIQIADNPGRHEPGTGEIHYENVFTFLEKEGYEGFVGLEYNPSGNSEKSLAWLEKLKKDRM